MKPEPLTAAEVQATPAGSALDILVAERVMGQARVDDCPLDASCPGVWEPPVLTWPVTDPHLHRYSRDIAAAWKVIEKLEADGWLWDVWGPAWPGDPHKHAKLARFEDHRKAEAWGDTAAHALSRAAVLTTLEPV